MVLAARGARNFDSGRVRVEDDGVARALKRRALKVHAESALAAVAVTALALLVP